MIIGFFGALLMALAGYLHSVYVGGVSLFYLLIVAQRFFGDASYAIIGPYSAEIWPARLRASGMGVGYGTGNIGKIIGPLGLAVIVGTSNFVKPEATLGAIVPALLYLAFWYGQAGAAFWLLGFETKRRSIEEIDATLARPAVLERAGAAGPAPRGVKDRRRRRLLDNNRRPGARLRVQPSGPGPGPATLVGPGR